MRTSSKLLVREDQPVLVCEDRLLVLAVIDDDDDYDDGDHLMIIICSLSRLPAKISRCWSERNACLSWYDVDEDYDNDCNDDDGDSDHRQKGSLRDALLSWRVNDDDDDNDDDNGDVMVIIVGPQAACPRRSAVAGSGGIPFLSWILSRI